jgi:hypothetical protein
MNKDNDYPLVFKGVLVEIDQFGDYYIDGQVTATKDVMGDCPLFKGTWFNFEITNYDELSQFTNSDLDREFKAKAIASLIEIHNDWLELRKPPEPVNQQAFRHCFE